MATSSSATKPRHLLNPHGTTAAPPPTPSTQPNTNHSSSSSDSAADTLSRLLHRLPPSLSLPSRLSPRATTSTTSTPTPTTPLPTAASLSPLPASAFELGYFQLQLTRHHHHSITPQLAESAESEALSLLNLPHDQKLTAFPRDWPLGFDDEDDGETAASLCLDGACSTTATELGLSLTSLRELTRGLEKVGLEVVESLASGVGFENPFSKKTEEPCSLMWISEDDDDKVCRVYPYVVGVQYQIRTRKWSLLSDTGPVVVEPEVGSVFVTLGDIAQVWSNGKLKKVRGRPAAISEVEEKSPDPVARSISMTLLITLPGHESTVSPLLAMPPKIKDNGVETEASNAEKDKEKRKSCDHESIEVSTSVDGIVGGEDDHSRVFNSFSFEDYAWRVYHERFPLKDPLERYRVSD